MNIRINVLGGLSVVRDATPMAGPVAQRRSLALLAVLAAHSPGGVSRQKAGTLLWPESDEAAARNSLKQTVYVVRRELGADVVLGSTELRLNTLAISSDLADFEVALLQGDGKRLKEVYTGPFLDGFHVGGDAREFERWVDGERTLLARRFDEALAVLASRAVLAGDHRTALDLWHRLAVPAPLNSRYAFSTVEALFATGDRTGALQHAEAHRSFLREELGLPLGADFEALITMVRSAAAPVSPNELSRPSPVQQTAAVLDVGPAVAAATPAPPARRRWSARVMAVAILAAAVVLPAWKLLSRAPPLDSKRIALHAAVDAGDDPSTSARVRVLTETMARRIAALHFATSLVLPREVGVAVRDAASRSGARYLIEATAAAGTPGAVEVSLTDLETGARLWGSRTSSVDQAGTDALAEQATTAVAVRADPNMTNWIAATSEPSSIETYQQFARGLAYFAEGEMADAESRFHAASRDSTFTMARVLVAWCNYYQGRQSVADSLTRALLPLRLPPLEVAMMELLAAIGRGDMDRQHQLGDAIAAMAVAGEWRYLAADVAISQGRGRESVRILEEIGPDKGWMRGSFWFWQRLDRGLHYIAAYDRELAAAIEARRRFPSNRILVQGYIKALAGLGRVDAIEAEIDRALTLRQKWKWGDSQPAGQAMHELLAHGHPEGARRVATRTMSWLRQQPAAEQDAWATVTPWFLFTAGEIDAARAGLERVIADDPRELEALELLAEIGVAGGDSAVARRADERLAAVSDPGLKVDVLLTRAGIAAALGERDQAIAFLRDSFRAGFAWRTVLHMQVGLVRLRGYPPFEQLIGPVE